MRESLQSVGVGSPPIFQQSLKRPQGRPTLNGQLATRCQLDGYECEAAVPYTVPENPRKAILGCRHRGAHAGVVDRYPPALTMY